MTQADAWLPTSFPNSAGRGFDLSETELMTAFEAAFGRSSYGSSPVSGHESPLYLAFDGPAGAGKTVLMGLYHGLDRYGSVICDGDFLRTSLTSYEMLNREYETEAPWYMEHDTDVLLRLSMMRAARERRNVSRQVIPWDAEERHLEASGFRHRGYDTFAVFVATSLWLCGLRALDRCLGEIEAKGYGRYVPASGRFMAHEKQQMNAKEIPADDGFSGEVAHAYDGTVIYYRNKKTEEIAYWDSAQGQLVRHNNMDDISEDLQKKVPTLIEVLKREFGRTLEGDAAQEVLDLFNKCWQKLLKLNEIQAINEKFAVVLQTDLKNLWTVAEPMLNSQIGSPSAIKSPTSPVVGGHQDTVKR